MITQLPIEEGGWLSLSSALTPLYKFGAPTLTAGATALLLLLGLAARDSGLLIGATVTALIGVYVFLYCGRMKTVILNAHTLQISTLRSAVSVPLDRLVDIEIKRLFYPPVAYLHFDGSTAAGRVVQFMPADVGPFRDNPALQAVIRLASTMRSAHLTSHQTRRDA